MDEAAWRITIALPEDGSAALREQLEESSGIDVGSNKDHVYVYAPTREEIERSVPTIRAALNTLSIEPTSIEIDQWLADETRWSGDNSEEGDGEFRGWVDTIVDGLARSSPI